MARRRLTARGKTKCQKQGDNSLVSGSNLKASASGTSSEYGLLNVAWRGDNLVLVERGPSGVVIRERRAEYACFIRNDIDDQTMRVIRDHRAVIGMKVEGDWIRVQWRSTREREELCNALKADGVETYEGDVSPVRRYMTDSDLNYATPRLAFFDIETDSRVPPRLAGEGNARILAWAVVDTSGRKRVGVLDDDTDVAERALLQQLFKVLEQYDQIAAWNGKRFDFPAVMERARRRQVAVNFDRWLFLDQMLLFKTMNTMAAESGDEKASFALGAIATALLGEGKDPFDASKTYEAWAAGGDERRRLVRYCVKDTDLLRRVEEKTGYIGLLQTLAETCNVFADSRGQNPTIQAEGFLLKLAKEQGYHFPTNFRRVYGEKFRGAYVMEPQGSGIIKNVHVGDFASLYPSIIVTWNMSPETLVQGEENLLELDLASAYAPIEDEYSCAPITGKYFSTAKEGILAHAVKEVMRLRKYWNDLKNTFPPGSDEWVSANRKSTAYKMAANSFYGVVGSPMSRFFSRDVAESVTQAGKWLILETIKAAEKRGMVAIYGDTDSLFIAGCSRAEFEEFCTWCNKELYPDLLKTLGCQENLITLAYEKEFERVIFTAAKKYCGRYVHYKGTLADASSKPEVKGLEYKRGDSIRLARQFQSEVVELLVGMVNGGVEDPLVYEEVVLRWRERILHGDIELDDIVIAKHLNKRLNEYSRKRKKDGEWAKQLPHIELARALHEQGEDMAEGAKVSYFVFDASDRKQVEYRTLAQWDGTCDRYEVWEKLSWPPTQRLLEAAFPGLEWQKRFGKVRPPKPRKAPKRRAKALKAQDAPDTPTPGAKATTGPPRRCRIIKQQTQEQA